MTFSPLQKAGFWLAFVAVFTLFIWIFNDILTPFILGMTIAYLLNPVMERLSHKKISRNLGALIILLIFFCILCVLLALALPVIVRQGQQFLESAPEYYQSFMRFVAPYIQWIKSHFGRDSVEQINASLTDNAGELVKTSGGIVGGLAMGGKVIIDIGTSLVLTPLVAYFMMVEWPHITRWVRSLYPRQHSHLIKGLMHKIDHKIAGFIRGQIIVAFILGVSYAIALTIAGLNYGFLIGIGTGIFSIIPLVGSTLGLVTAVSVAWFQEGDLSYVGIIAGIFFLGQFLEGNFLSPKIVGNTVGLHPLWVIFALMAGGALFGILGMLIAIPVAAVVGVLSDFAIEQYKSSPLYLKNPEEQTIILEDHGP